MYYNSIIHQKEKLIAGIPELISIRFDTDSRIDKLIYCNVLTISVDEHYVSHSRCSHDW